MIVTNTEGSDELLQQNIIEVTSEPNAQYSYEINNDEVIFTNLSLNYTNVTWDFDNGSSSTDTNPSHIYAQSGIYNVQLTAINKCNSDQIAEEIEANAIVTAFDRALDIKEIMVYPNPALDEIIITNMDGKEELIFSIYDINGRLLKINHNQKLNKEIKIDVSMLSSGLLLLYIQSSNEHVSIPFLKE